MASGVQNDGGSNQHDQNDLFFNLQVGDERMKLTAAE
jgi:hypothetical protein